MTFLASNNRLRFRHYLIKKDSAVQSSYNQALKELQQDGTVKRLSQKYFGVNITE